ncbi:hypothetical protein HY086_02330 [Candidatus Gottesmanbacteria bacterium]|nr:hypothetical protein [Candidatus Gottesmanbacteria bacterium]
MDILKLNDILKQAPYLTKQNLALALSQEGENLNYWIKKLAKEKRLIRLKKGWYASSYYMDLISQEPKNREMYIEYLANVLRFPSYVSLEYVLSTCGLLPESAFAITSITVKTPRVYTTDVGTFIYRNIKDSLFSGYRYSDFNGKKVRIASPAKALFDFLYLKKLTPPAKRKEYLLRDGRINWDVLKTEDKIEFLSFVQRSGSGKMRLIAALLKKEKIL